MKSDKAPCIIYADLESSMKKKKDNSKNNLQESLATNVGEHAPCG